MFLQWLDQHSGAVAGLAAITTAVATIALAVFTAVYVRIIRRQTRLVKAQTEHLLEQDRARLRRSIQAIVVELEDNVQCIEYRNPAPLSSDSYFAYRSVLYELGVSPETRKALADAAHSAQRFNSELAGDSTGRVRVGESQRAWELASRNIPPALEVMKKDPGLSAFFGSERMCP
jgi:hypothetical protein